MTATMPIWAIRSLMQIAQISKELHADLEQTGRFVSPGWAQTRARSANTELPKLASHDVRQPYRTGRVSSCLSCADALSIAAGLHCSIWGRQSASKAAAVIRRVHRAFPDRTARGGIISPATTPARRSQHLWHRRKSIRNGRRSSCRADTIFRRNPLLPSRALSAPERATEKAGRNRCARRA